MIVDDWQLETHKTKDLHTMVKDGLGLGGKKILLVFDGENDKLELAARNHPEIGALRALQVHAYHVLDAELVVMSKAAAEQLGEVLAK